MRTNEAGLAILERYDVVHVGKGKVEYTVLSDVVTAEAHIESKNTGKAQTVEASRLTLVRDIRTVPEVWALILEEADLNEEPVKETTIQRERLSLAQDVRDVDGVPHTELAPELEIEEAEAEEFAREMVIEEATPVYVEGAASEAELEYNRSVDAEEPVKETSAYAKAVLFALNKLQKHVYAGTVRENVKAKRRGLGRRQKASRKANR